MTGTAYETSKPGFIASLTQRVSTWFQTASPFQRNFIEGLIAGFIVLLLLLFWMGLRADRTAEKIQSSIPFEAVEILRPVAKETHPIGVDMNAAETALAAQNALPKAPLEGLSENKGGHLLPIIRARDNLTPFNAYKRPFSPVAGRPMVAVVVVDYGLSALLSERALHDMPLTLTYALTPYADDAAGWGDKARLLGHEFWLTLPMQAKSPAEDNGPNAITISSSLQDNQDRIFASLGAAVGYAGLISQKNHAYGADDVDVSSILKNIYGRGLAFVESNADGAAFGELQAVKESAPYGRGSVWLGDDLRPDGMDRALQTVEKIAMKDGRAILFVQPYPVVLDTLKTWLAGTDERGLQIAPLSAVLE